MLDLAPNIRRKMQKVAAAVPSGGAVEATLTLKPPPLGTAAAASEGNARIALCILLILAAFTIPAPAADGLAALSQIDHADHGATQVTWLLHDRPHLAELVTPGNSIWNWLRDAFDYEDDGEKLYWDPSPSPATEIYGGQTRFFGGTKIIFVHIGQAVKEGPRAGEDMTAEELLRTAVFELNNARHRRQMREIATQALTGKISRDQFILAIAGTEFLSTQGTKKFETDVWQPFCARWQIQSDPRIWSSDQSPSFDDWMKAYPPGSIYPWRMYGLEYDEMMANYKTALQHDAHH